MRREGGANGDRVNRLACVWGRQCSQRESQPKRGQMEKGTQEEKNLKVENEEEE